MKIFLKADAPSWHIAWMDYHIAAYKHDLQLYDIEKIDPANRAQSIGFVQYLRDKGYDAWRYIPLEGDDYIYVRLCKEQYLCEQLRFI